MKYKISYKYLSPGPAGPFKGKDILDYKPSKGDEIYAPFGKAIIISARLVK